MAHVLETFAQFERRLVGQRTREALAVKRKQGVGDLGSARFEACRRSSKSIRSPSRKPSRISVR